MNHAVPASDLSKYLIRLKAVGISGGICPVCGRHSFPPDPPGPCPMCGTDPRICPNPNCGNPRIFNTYCAFCNFDIASYDPRPCPHCGQPRISKSKCLHCQRDPSLPPAPVNLIVKSPFSKTGKTISQYQKINLYGKWLAREGLIDDESKLRRDIGLIRFKRQLGAWVLEFRPNLPSGYLVLLDEEPVPDPKPKSIVLGFPKELKIGMPIFLHLESADS